LSRTNLNRSSFWPNIVIVL